MSTATATGGVAREVARRIELMLCREWPMIGAVDVRPAAERAGCEISIALDPVVVGARAEQQGSGDGSVGSAAAEPRVRAALADCVDRVNRTLSRHETIVGWSILS